MKILTHLGKASAYDTAYNPALLEPISRAWSRQKLGLVTTEVLPFAGYDLWTAYEMSWLNLQGKPVVVVGEFYISASSKNLIESKSLKLYLNSFNQSRFANLDAVIEILKRDLSAAVEDEVKVVLYAVDAIPAMKNEQVIGVSLDCLDISVDHYYYNPELLCHAATDSEPVVNERLYSHLLKSNCLVTSQPDWGSLVIDYVGKAINHEKLLKYIISFRMHNGFHEQCVEQMFIDIKKYCAPQTLTLLARYTRRGGIDINPLRTDNKAESTLLLGRLLRQ